jgi:asparagine N-glycosylation enzyme membrane subunit Stt3
MEIILFTLNAIVIYFLADWIVRQIESRRDKALKYRQVVFFVVILVLALTSFRLLQTLLAA